MSNKKKPQFINHDRVPLLMNPMGRRMFLRGLGSSLAIPFLPSLIPKAYAQAITDQYFIFANVTHGRLINAWNPLTAAPVTVGTGVKAQPLANINGPLGYIAGNRFDDLRAKMCMLQGLDAVASSDHYWFPWSASTNVKNNGSVNEKITPLFPYSIDQVLSESKKVYPNGSSLPVLRIDPREAYHTYSFGGPAGNGTAKINGAMGGTIASTWNAVSKFISPTGGGTGGGTAVDLAAAKKKFLVDQFLSESKTVLTGRAISSEDKNILQNYVDNLNEVQKRLASPTTQPPVNGMACTQPNIAETSDNLVFNQRLIDIMTLAMACGATKIGMYHLNWVAGMSQQNLGDRYSPNVHDTIHNFNNGGSAYTSMKSWWGQALDHYGRMIRNMDSLGLLDKSVIVFTSDFSSSNAGHIGVDLPVLTAGSLNGKLEQGKLISYYNQKISQGAGRLEGSSNYTGFDLYGGRLYNEFLQSILVAAGLTPAEYQRNGSTGFGTYNQVICGDNTLGCLGANATDVAQLSYKYYQSYNQPRTATLPYFLKV
jgi:hypothetical protein